MEKKSIFKNPEYWLVKVIFAIMVVLGVLVYSRLIIFHAPVGAFFLHHWMSWAGAIFISVFTPVYYFLKRRYPKKYQLLVRTHIFGNLVSFGLITLHFAHHLGRPAEAGPESLTGRVMYIALSFLILTGFLLRFQLLKKQMKSARYIHTSIITTFYIIIIFHVLHGLGYL